jgi:hypothetical protein
MPPNEAEIQDQFGKAARILEDTSLVADAPGLGGTSLLDRIAAVTAVLETDYSAEAEAGLATYRAALNSCITQGRPLLDPFLLTYGQFIEEPRTTTGAILSQLYEHFIDNALRIETRGFTFGSPAAAGGNVGDGVLNRLNTDPYGFDIENQTPDSKTVRCNFDINSGTSTGAEIFRIYGENFGRDNLRITGSGREGTLRGMTGQDSQEFISNPSFSSFLGTLTVPTDITDWTPASGGFTNLDLDQTNFYRTFEGEGDPTSLKFLGNETVSQTPSLVRRPSFEEGYPYYVQIAYNRQVFSGDGTLLLQFGPVGASVVLAAQTGWNILRIPVSTDNWFRNFNADPLVVRIDLSGNTTGEVLVDDFVCGRYTNFDGSWYAMVGGGTPFLIEDEFTFSDTCTESIIQQWLWRVYGSYLPSVTAATPPTWVDPT